MRHSPLARLRDGICTAFGSRPGDSTVVDPLAVWEDEHETRDGSDAALVRRQIEQVLRCMEDAVGRRDLKDLLAHFAEGFEEMDISGKRYDTKAVRKGLRQLFLLAPSFRYSAQLQKVSLVMGEADCVDDSATNRAEVVSREIMEIGGHSGILFKFAPILCDETWHSVWVRQNQEWRLLRHLSLSRNVTRGGKVLNTARAVDADQYIR